MARFSITLNGQKVPLKCVACGGADMFKHNAALITCNKCGHTVAVASEPEVIVEVIVPAAT